MTLRDQVLAELDALIEDVEFTEKTHLRHAESKHAWHLKLGVSATVLSAIAGFASLRDAQPWFTSTAAFLAVAVTGTLTFAKPDQSGDRHLDAGRQLNALKVMLRQYRSIDLYPSQREDPAGWTAALATFAQQKADIDNKAPGTSERAFIQARDKIRRGDFRPGEEPDGDPSTR